jgi:VIT1/CCC1 family predicted Fe2+/Mn2+ transporter
MLFIIKPAKPLKTHQNINKNQHDRKSKIIINNIIYSSFSMILFELLSKSEQLNNLKVIINKFYATSSDNGDSFEKKTR